MASRNLVTALVVALPLTLSSHGFAADDSGDSLSEPSSNEDESDSPRQLVVPPEILAEIFLNLILPRTDVQSIVQTAQVNRALNQAIVGSDAGAQLLWLRLLVEDFNGLYPNSVLKAQEPMFCRA